MTTHEIGQALPARADAEVLFCEYVAKINWAHHIIHVPTTHRYMETIYKDLGRAERPSLSHLALVATIFAVTAHHSLGSLGLAISEADAQRSCRKWLLLAHRAMSEANHLTSPTLETIQAVIFLSQHLPTTPQIANRSAVQALLLNSAHHLQLHQVDSDRARSLRSETGADMIELELKRRVWWNLVSTDWYE